MKQSLPGIKAISYVECSKLTPNIQAKFMAGIPIAVYSPTTHIIIYGDASCETDTSYDNNIHVEKTEVKFRTTDVLPLDVNIAFVIEDVEKKYIVGTAEAPYPVVECTHEISEDRKIREYKVKYVGRKALIEM